MNQRKATCSTLLAVLQERGVNYELNGSTPISEVLTEGDKKATRDALFAMFRAGQVEMSEEFKVKSQDDSALKSYISGLVNNWIRKAPEFNAGSHYTPKNPGSRQGSGDQQVREMKKLLSATNDPETKKVIQSHIESRIQELKPVETGIDFDKIPESLKAKLGIK